MRFRSSLRLLLLSGLWLFQAASGCLAQAGGDGLIAGRVLSSSGSPVAGAQVEAQELDSGLVLHAVSGKRGEFLVPRLTAGEYRVTVAQAGMRVLASSSLVVHEGELTRIDIRLAATVSASISSDPGAGGTIAEAGLGLLPVDAGEWKALAEVAPGANDADQGDQSPTFRGAPPYENSSRLDGTSADLSFTGDEPGAGAPENAGPDEDGATDQANGPGSGPRSVAGRTAHLSSSYAFAQSAVREFRMQGQASAAAFGSALYGHGIGGVVTTVSRSGGTHHHGMVFLNVRDSAWAAVDPFSIASTYRDGVVSSSWVKPADVLQQFGGRIGGPLLEHSAEGRYGTPSVRSRLFYFYAFDEQRRNFPAVSSPGYASFYALTATQKALLANRGVSPSKANAALNYLASLTGSVTRRSDQTVNFGRLDWDRAGGTRLVLEYNRARWSSLGGTRTGSVVDRGIASLGSRYGNVDFAVARWVQYFRTELSNELRLQYGHELLYETAPQPAAQEPNVGPGGLPPEISIGPDGFVFGTPASLGQRAYPDERRLEAADDLALVKGRHFVQLGADFSALRDFTDTLTNAQGTFSYDSGTTSGHAGGLVDWITDYTFGVNAYPNGGCPSIYAMKHDFCFRSYSQSFGPLSLTFHTQEWAAFVQDDWRIAARLTFHAGLRYEYEFLPLPLQPNAALDAIFGTVGATSVFPEDRNNFAPRLGLEWSPSGSGRLLLRAGYGAYYGKLPGATIRTALLDTDLAASTTRVHILPTTETVCPQNPSVGFGYPCSYLTRPAGAVAATSSAVVFDRRFRLPMVQQATLSMEGLLSGGIQMRAAYVMNLDRQLPNSVDINIAPSTAWKQFQLVGGLARPGVQTGEAFSLPVYTARVTPSFGPVTDVISNADATYHGLTLEARRAFSGRAGEGGIGTGLEFRFAYTWSKAIDYGQNSGAIPRGNGQLDPFTNRYDKGLSALNFPQRIVGTVIWSPQWHVPMVAGEAGAALHSLVNGWSVAGILYAGSGREYSYDIFGGTRLTGGRESINGSGGSVVLPTVGRNTLRLPPAANVDLRLSRLVRVGERMRLRGSVEGFNVTNHVNYSGLQQRAFLVGTPGVVTAPGVTPLIFQDAATIASEGLNTQPFGTYTSAGSGESRERQVQLGLRMEF